MDARDRHNGQRDERTDEVTRLFVRPSVRPGSTELSINHIKSY